MTDGRPRTLSCLVLVALVVELIAGSSGRPRAAVALASDPGHADICLEVDAAVLPLGAWPAIEAAADDMTADQAILFPEPTMASVPPPDPASAQPGSWRLDVHAGHLARPPVDGAPCLRAHGGWTARYDRGFLVASAERLLEQTARTPGFSAGIELEWLQDAATIRTKLTFAGPMDIPHGTCWIEDALSIDPSTGTVAAGGLRGLDTSFMGDAVCGRFYDSLPDGGAGQQAVGLLPASVALADGRSLHFVAAAVAVEPDAIVVSGPVEVR